MIFANFLIAEFTIFADGLESNCSFVSDPTNLYFLESPNPELFKKYKLRLGQINHQRASGAGVVGPPRIREISFVQNEPNGPFSEDTPSFFNRKMIWLDLWLKLVVAHPIRFVGHFLCTVHLILDGAQFSQSITKNGFAGCFMDANQQNDHNYLSSCSFHILTCRRCLEAR